MARRTQNPGTGRGIVFVPVDSFSAKLSDGVDWPFHAYKTTIREGHEALSKLPHMFVPITCDYEVANSEPRVEQATAAPGEKRKR